MKERHEKKEFKLCVYIFFVMLNAINLTLCFAVPWLYQEFNEISFDEVLFTFTMPMAGTNLSTYVKNVSICVILPAIVATALIQLVMIKIYKPRKGTLAFQKSIVQITILEFISAMIMMALFLHIGDFFKHSNKYSVLIEKEYVDPKNVTMKFPKKKRNLIYVYMESMESSLVGKSNGGITDQDYIPELTELCKKYTNFTPNNKIGGFYCVAGTNYTSAALTAQTMGIPLKEIGSFSGKNLKKEFLPKVTALGDLLQEQGYDNYFTIGSEADFGGRQTLFETHGDYNIFDYNTAIRKGYISKDYKVWWGYEDNKLFEYAKKDLNKISQKDKPFNYTLLTVDTHYPDGYKCKLCKNEFDSQYKNVYACSSRQVYSFVRWIQKQDFYDNTTIILCGDHTTVNGKMLKGIKDEKRQVYNVIINAPIVEKTQKRDNLLHLICFQQH